MGRQLIAHVVGARPNYMKVAPVYAALERRGGVEQLLIHTGQHYSPELREVLIGELPLPAPHVQLDAGSGPHGEQTARALAGVEHALLERRPDVVVVAGDVNSTLAGALAAVKLEIPVVHIESGLRSFDWSMPEEHNRRLTDHVSSLLLTHSEDANRNLAAEGIPAQRIAFVGNTMIDSLFSMLGAARAAAAWEELGLEGGRYLLVTLHRPGLVDVPELLSDAMDALDGVAESIPVVFPVHPRTRARIDELGRSGGKVTLTPPLSYTQFVSLESQAAAVLTDSAGVQEETTALGVRCFTLRAVTERPVTVTDGTNTVLGLDPRRIADVPALLDQPLPVRTPPLWDGAAGERAADAIERLLAEADRGEVAGADAHRR